MSIESTTVAGEHSGEYETYHRWLCSRCGAAGSWLNDIATVLRMASAHDDKHASELVVSEIAA